MYLVRYKLSFTSFDKYRWVRHRFQQRSEATMYTYDALDALLDSGNHDAAHAYLEEFVDRVPRNDNEAREHCFVAVEVHRPSPRNRS